MASSTASWLTDYMSALQVRDSRDKANKDLYDAYTKLADHAASTAITASPATAPSSAPPPQRQTPSPSPSKPHPASSTTSPPGSDSTADVPRLRASLTTTNRALSALQTQHAALQSERDGLAQQTRQLAPLQRDKAALERRLRDRDEELRGKARLVETVQDDLVAAEMQLNVAEERMKKLERENAELVERWMRRVGWEAEEMNRGNDQAVEGRRKGSGGAGGG